MTEIVEEARRRRPWLLFAILAATLVLLAAGNLIQLLLINPTAQDNKSDISRLDRNQTRVVCALARQTAHFYRNRVVAPSGGLESIDHFRQRMLDQRRVLRLARGLDCPGAGKGFRRSIRLALLEIASVLKRTKPPPEKRQVQQSKGEGTAIDIPSLAAGTSPSASAGGGHRQDQPSADGDGAGGAGKQHGPRGDDGGGGGGPQPGPDGGPAPPPEPAPGGPPPQAEQAPPPQAEEPKPDPPANGKREVSLCVENPLLPVCIGVKGNAVGLE